MKISQQKILMNKYLEAMELFAAAMDNRQEQPFYPFALGVISGLEVGGRIDADLATLLRELRHSMHQAIGK
jgi:hypothetical protein